MCPEARRRSEEALRLPAKEGIQLASEWLASAKGEAAPDDATSWAAEVERRAHLVLSDKAATHDWHEVRQHLERKHLGLVGVLWLLLSACATPSPRLWQNERQPAFQGTPRGGQVLQGGVRRPRAQAAPAEEELPGQLRGLQEVQARAWELAQRLKRKGAWLEVRLRVHSSRVEWQEGRAHEGTGPEVKPARSEDFALTFSLAVRVAGEGQVGVVLSRHEETWFPELPSCGPWESGERAPHATFARNKEAALKREKGRWVEEEMLAVRALSGWLERQTPRTLAKEESPLLVYARLLTEFQLRREQLEKHQETVRAKLDEYEEWAKWQLALYAVPMKRLEPGYWLQESPLRIAAVKALVRATLGWAYSHMSDPAFLHKPPSEVAIYLLKKQASLASLWEVGLKASPNLLYVESDDPEAYTTKEVALELALGLAPYVGEVTDYTSFFSGYSPTGHLLTYEEGMWALAGMVVPLVGGRVLSKGAAEVEQLGLVVGRSAEDVLALARVTQHMAPGELTEVERLAAKLTRGEALAEQEVEFLRKVAKNLEKPLEEVARRLKAGQKVPLMGARVLPDGSRLVPGSPAHKAQCWVEYQFRHPEKYKRIVYEVDPEWERMYRSIIENKPAGNAFEALALQAGQYEKNVSLMMPPPGSGLQGFIPDAVKGAPEELVWGQPYHFVEVKARKELSDTGNLKAMLDYVEKFGGHLELWVRSAKHADGATHLSNSLQRRLKTLEGEGLITLQRLP